ncbi:hypothetical protein AVEN_248282-1 [Araneus ventricosus]|uniref:Mutator-like transposase domain-containing protein n=1 Tax=Araneus ventricosus TaxID=182803 RepID=A0A4Y2VCM0_ARAVE|nr:hypothetical protein AVEN_248282-1 [Araneus ventricosus]
MHFRRYTCFSFSSRSYVRRRFLEVKIQLRLKNMVLSLDKRRDDYPQTCQTAGSEHQPWLPDLTRNLTQKIQHWQPDHIFLSIDLFTFQSLGISTGETNSRKGLATSLFFISKSCGCSTSSMTSYISQNGYDINTRLVYGMRCIGKGKCASRTLCAVVNLPHPPAKFERLNSSLCRALLSACSKSMLKAVEGAVSRNDNTRDITVALVGYLAKKGSYINKWCHHGHIIGYW